MRHRRSKVITIIAEAPGIGKTTILKDLSDRRGWSSFELSIMPEFGRMNGVDLSYEKDERITIEALVAIANCELQHAQG